MEKTLKNGTRSFSIANGTTEAGDPTVHTLHSHALAKIAPNAPGDTGVSKEGIEDSIKRFELVAKRIEERAFLRTQTQEPHSMQLDDRRGSIEDEKRFYEETLPVEEPGHFEEEERSKSDGENEEANGPETPENLEERSKSDGEQDEEDDDAVELKISAAAEHKSYKLSLSNSWLKVIPAEIWNLVQLTELDLSANYIKKVSKSIGDLANLRRLRLNHNQLSVLPKELWTLTRITMLFLNNNNLKTIPKEIKSFVHLKTLDFSSNQIMEIPPKDGIFQLPSLVELRLRNNLITTLPQSLGEFTQLQVLWLEGNPIASLPKALLKKPAAMVLAYLRDNKPSKRPTLEAKTRVARRSPPTSQGATILPEKEMKKRKREQLEEMKKHLEVEKKVKQLEHELMLANAKAQKYEEEARSTPAPVPTSPAPTQPTGGSAPQASTPIQYVHLPPRVPRQQGPMPANMYQPFPPPGFVMNTVPASPNTDPTPSPVFEWEIPLSELQFGPRIGRGGYGEVYRGMWEGTEIAAKMLFNDHMSAKLLSDLRKEVDLLCKLRHPNIMLFMGACTHNETPCIVTEYLGRGSLATLLQDESMEMDWGLRLQMAIDSARGLTYLHTRNPIIIHRDVKTENLLVDDNWQVKVGDFGLATVKSHTFAKTMCGTTGFVAPEVLAEQGYTEKADVYSFAVILWEIFTRQIPYAGKNTMQVVRSVDRGERLVIPENCPKDYAALITECWDSDPAARPTFPKILERLEKMRSEYLARTYPPMEPNPLASSRDPGHNSGGHAPHAASPQEETTNSTMDVDDGVAKRLDFPPQQLTVADIPFEPSYPVPPDIDADANAKRPRFS